LLKYTQSSIRLKTLKLEAATTVLGKAYQFKQHDSKRNISNTSVATLNSVDCF